MVLPVKRSASLSTVDVGGDVLLREDLTGRRHELDAVVAGDEVVEQVVAAASGGGRVEHGHSVLSRRWTVTPSSAEFAPPS